MEGQAVPGGPMAAEEPPGSRLFVVCGRTVEEETLRQAFRAFGTVQHVKVVRDKGVAFVKMARASEAELSIENLNGAVLNNGRGPKLKVLLAEPPTARGVGAPQLKQATEELLSSDPDNLPPRSRLFVVVPKSADSRIIQDEMAGFKDLEYVKTDLIASKGVVFVKYSRASSAARAMEEVCAKGTLGPYKVKCMLAEPKTKRNQRTEGSGGAVVSPGSGAGAAGLQAAAMFAPHQFNVTAAAAAAAAAAASAGKHPGASSHPTGLDYHAMALEQQAALYRQIAAAGAAATPQFGAPAFGTGGNPGSALAAVQQAAAAAAAAGDFMALQGLSGISATSAAGGGLMGGPALHAGAGAAGSVDGALGAPSVVGLAGFAGLGGLPASSPEHNNGAGAPSASGALGSVGAGTPGGPFHGGASPSPGGGGGASTGLAGSTPGSAAGLSGTAFPPPGGMSGAYGPVGNALASPIGTGGATGYGASVSTSGVPVSRQRLFVVVHKSVSDEVLARLFRTYPGMEYCDLKRDKATGRSKGYCYVNYSTPEAAATAIAELHGTEFPPGSGFRLKVMPAEIMAPGSGGSGASGASSSGASTSSLVGVGAAGGVVGLAPGGVRLPRSPAGVLAGAGGGSQGQLGNALPSPGPGPLSGSAAPSPVGGHTPLSRHIADVGSVADGLGALGLSAGTTVARVADAGQPGSANAAEALQPPPPNSVARELMFNMPA